MSESISIDGQLLSPTQRRLWALLQVHGVEIRNLFICEIRDSLDTDRLRNSFRKVVGNHEELRLCYVASTSNTDVPSFVTASCYEPPLAELDLTPTGTVPVNQQTDGWCTRLLNEAFILDEGHAKFAVATAGPSQFYVMGSVPAINADGPSLRKFVADLEAAYCNRDYPENYRGQPRFRDIAAWSNTTKDSGAAESFWKNYLAQVPWNLQLPIEHKVPVGGTFQNASLTWELPPALLHAAKTRGKEVGEWLRIQLATAAEAWLSNVCAANRVFVGVMANDRIYPELYEAFGPYEKEIPLYADLTETTTFADLSGAVEMRLRDLFDWQEGFGLELADATELPIGGLREYPLCIDVRNSSEPVKQSGTTFSITTLLCAADAYAIKLDCETSDDAVRAQICYNAAAYNPESIRRVQEQLNTILFISLEHPEERVLGVDFSIGADRIVVAASSADQALAEAGTFQQMFDRQAAFSTDAVALSEGERHITYGCLHKLSTHFANRLIQEAAIAPDTLIALHMRTCVEAPLAILSILKAGAAYVPVDPDWPEERINTVLREAEPAAVLTTSWCSQAEAAGIPQITCALSSFSAWTQSPAANLQTSVAAENLAYVLYTSGTSGVPKGAMITHRGLANYISWCASAYQIAESRGAIVHSPITFDFTVTCLLAPLTVGACVYICETDHPLEGLADALTLLDEVSVIKLTPTSIDSLHRLMQQREILCRVRRIVVGGEALSGSKHLWSIARQLDSVIVNEYGPTECVVGSNVYEVHYSEPTEGPIPIGQPIANTRTPILKQNGDQSERWVPGEIYIGGCSVARGYLKRPGLTAASFAPNSDDTQAGARFYKTGDTARRLGSGDLLYLGRRDTQVKIRGHRIDLKEVESALRRSPNVSECVVTVTEQADSHQRMMAFVVVTEPDSANIAELRAHLAALLPSYMLPNILHIVPSLPVTENGKIDTKFLQASLADVGLRPKKPKEKPQSAMERMLHDLWLEVLRCKDIGIDDNFFELGGDSILSIQFLARAHEAGLRLRPKHLSQHPTIRELAVTASKAVPSAIPEARESKDPSLAPIQQWFFERAFEQPDHYNQSVLLKFSRPWTLPQFEQALAALIEHHDALRLCFERSETGYRQFYSAQPEQRIISVVDCSGLNETELQERLRTTAREAQLSMKLDRAPLLRMVLYSRTEADTLLYVLAHHLIIDHVSWTILLEDLQLALERVTAGPSRASGLSRTTSYGAWVECLAKDVHGAKLDQERAYWMSEQWSGVPSFPVDYPRNLEQNRVQYEDSVTVKLDRSETHKLIHETLRAYHTRPVELLIAAYAAAYSLWSDHRVLTLDFESHGRDAGNGSWDVTRTIGWFTALYPVYIALTNPRDVRALITDVKEAMRAVPAGGSGYGLLRYGSERSESHTWHNSNVVFNFLGEVDRAISSSASFTWVPLSLAENRSPKNTRPHLLEIGAYISDGELRVTFTYGSSIQERSSVTKLSGTFLEQLRSIIDHCSSRQTTRYTPSDFPLANLSQDTLDSITEANPDLEDIYPLSHVQKGMLFHATRSCTARAYLVQLSMDLSGLDEKLFEDSWRKVFARHTALRTSFLWEAIAEPLQIVHRDITHRMIKMDWRGENETTIKTRFEDWAAQQMAGGLDLKTAPLHRFGLFRVGDKQFKFVWLYHHILVDGWSTSNILREVLSFYAAANVKTAGPLPPAAPYRDYIEWLVSRSWEDSREYWLRAMSGVTAGTTLALGKKLLPERASHAHRDEMLHLVPDTIDGIISLARTLRIPPNVVVQGAWALVLSRYAQKDDVIFGVTVSGRPYDLPSVEHRVGLFLNTLPMRVILNRSATVAEYLSKIHSQLQDLLQYDYTPLFEVSRICQLPEGDALFESILVFENFPMVTDVDVLQGEAAISNVSSVEQTNYPLTIVVAGNEGNLSVKAVYDPVRYTPEIIQQILTQLREVLTAMASGIEERLGHLPVTWSQRTLCAEPGSETDQSKWTEPIHRIFENQVLKTPDTVAVVHQAQSLSYGMLNRRANQLAWRLVELGAGPETYVAICVERSLEMIVAIFATLKAGAAYIPIDCRFPAERVAKLTSHATLVILDETTRNSFVFGDTKIVDLHLDAAELATKSEDNLLQIISSPQQVAYLMYTSGSSGTPKGTLITNENVTRLFGTGFQLYNFATDGVWSFFHSIAFDFSVWEIFGALITGGRLIVTPYWMARSPDEFADLIRRERISVLSQTPSAFRELLQVGKLTASKEPLNLKWVVFGGEALYLTPLIEYCRDLESNGTRLVNMYGITETTVHVTHRLMDDYHTLDGRSYIGQPLPDLSIHLLDQHLSPVPDGVAGEICVAGKGVARGYLDSPRLTAERFVPNPFSTQIGRRIYRSGDLARTAGEFDLEYLGRADRQVKIRGFRIELDEILFHLRKQPAVRDALVHTMEDHVGDHILVAYVIPSSADLAVPALRTALHDNLPDYMVPSAIHILDSFPLTPNGKIDYNVLSSLTDPEIHSRQEFVPPQTWEQELIADVWREALGLSRVGIYESFFALGGDSIKALRIVARLRSLGFEASTEALFEHSSIAALSRAMPSKASPPAHLVSDVGLRESQEFAAQLPAGVIDLYPATQLQLGMLFHGGEAGEEPAHYHNVSLLRLEGPFDEVRFRATVEKIVAKHPALRTAFVLEGYDRPMQAVFSDVDLPVTVVSLGELSAEERESHVQSWIDSEKRQGFSFDQPPLIRFHVMVCSSQEFYLGVTEHHTILDGWSVASLLTELFETYLHPSLGGESNQPYNPNQNSFRTYALLEREAIESSEHQTFWNDYLDGYTPLHLPAKSASRRSELSHPSKTKKARVALEPSLTARLRELSQDIQVPFKSVLLAAHVAVLGFLANEPDTITGVITHGRPETDGGDASLGLFLNTLPLRLKQAPIPWKAWIQQVFNQELRILSYRRYPLATMRDEHGRPPTLSTAFNYTNFHIYDRLPQDGAIKVLDIAVEESTNFDLLTDFSLLSHSGEMELTLSYSSAKFDPAQIDTMLDCYLQCLELMARASARTMSLLLDRGKPDSEALPALTKPESRWSHVQELIATTINTEWFDRIVVVDGDRHLSYGELSAKVTEMIGRLRKAGLTPEDPVAVLTDKSLEWVISALAVIQAGGVYVPLDRTDPADRIKYILADTQASIMLTDQRGAKAFSNGVQNLVLVDCLHAAPSRRHTIPDQWPVLPDNLAYILYTSGSTGKPKGVAMHHGGLANLMSWQSQAMVIEDHRILQFASPGFDVSVQEILTTLYGGNTLVIAPADMRRDFVALTQLVFEQQVQCVFAPDTVIKALLMTARDCGAWLPALRMIINAGEALTIEHELLQFLASGGKLYNHYGPTESHVVTAVRIGLQDIEAEPRASIGDDILGAHIAVLDWWSRPVLPDTVGEIYIDALGVARGYHHAPGLTAERFLPNPIPHGKAGSRVFRTGDLGYRDRDGVIWFKGRADTQIKLRGYRIELEEIRQVLLEHPDVADAIVSTTGDQDEKQICAFLISPSDINSDAVREFASRALPTYMVPSVMMRIASCPTTRNGKIDYAKLAVMAAQPAAPTAKVEGVIGTELVALWKEVLRNEKELGPGQDFLQIGGNSILLLQLQLKLRKRFGVSVPIATLALNSSFARMCRCIDDALDRAGISGGAPMSRYTDDPALHGPSPAPAYIPVTNGESVGVGESVGDTPIRYPRT